MAKVTRSALHDAASVAGLMITTEAISRFAGLFLSQFSACCAALLHRDCWVMPKLSVLMLVPLKLFSYPFPVLLNNG